MKPEISIIPERAPGIEKRKPLTRNEVAQLMLDQSGLCGCGCGKKLQPLTEGFVDEHVIPLAAGGTNALSNRKLLRPECAKAKTKADQAPIKKGRHQAGGKGSQQARRAAGKTPQIAKPPVSPLSKAARRDALSRMEQQRARREGNRNV